MSFAVDDENRFFIEPYHMGSQLRLNFDRAGQLVIEVGSDVHEVTLDTKTVKALIAWLDQNVGG